MVHPATLGQVTHYHRLGLRERILNLPVMVGLVLSLIWRQVGGVSDLVRLVTTELVLWVPPLKITQQALSERLRSLPAELFLQVLLNVLPRLHAAWGRRQRPLPPEIAWAQAHYTQVALVDGSTLDALIRKVGLLRDALVNPLAGRMTGLLDLCSRLPFQIWYEADAQAHDQRFWPRILAALQAGALLIFDLGYTNFTLFTQMTRRRITFITRAKRNLAYSFARSLHRSRAVHDSLVWIGSGEERQLVRLIEVLYKGAWYRYLTNELDLTRLPTEYVVALYWQRWRIEIVFTQMTKTNMSAGFGGRDDIADFHLGVIDNHPVNQQFHQFSFLVKCSLGQSLLDPLTESFNRRSDGANLNLFMELGF
jgi:hypothetical protein